MTHVIKRGGEKKQVFNAAKIRNSVKKVARDLKWTPSKIEKLVRDVAEPAISFFKAKRIVKAVDIRRSLLGRLDRTSKAVSRAWRSYEKRK